MFTYELIHAKKDKRNVALGILVFLCFCGLSICLVLLWQNIHTYEEPMYPKLTQTSPYWVDRAISYSRALKHQNPSDLRKPNYNSNEDYDVSNKYIVCYYSSPDSNDKYVDLNLTDFNASLCTHINLGMSFVFNNTIRLSDDFVNVLKYIPQMKKKYPSLKLLLWIGGGSTASDGFSEMIKNHQNRKLFIQSLKSILHTYKLDGCDLDWEFPSAYNRERMHFSQLLYEIRQEYKREKSSYLLSVAVAAPEGIALFSYDVGEINKYADYVNIMTYDYHFYTKGAPFTGLNAPLYARKNEHSILATLNINYSVNWWITNGLERKKIVIGLPAYGHSYSLVNPFNTKIGAPASDYGHTGNQGFVSAGETCWFLLNNILSCNKYDNDTCSPYVSSGSEWISFENELSITCKANYIKSMQLGGAMLFSLNTDDFSGYCKNGKYPLLRTIYNVLMS
uniref:GH18 domain-containing protein n=1 Tax=Stomoxys calcitrans TaxID=35570 RepID=A0A1I8NSV0_STOCA